jgi:tetratricopeptide (TPR) repeat protein
LVDVDLQSAIARRPDDVGLKQASISLHIGLGKSLQELGRSEESLAMLTHAAEQSDRLLAVHEPSFGLYETAFQAWDALGYLLIRKYATESEGNPEAERVLARSVEVARLCVEQAPGDPRFATALASTQINYAGALRRSKHYDEARAIYESARDSMEQVTRNFPDNMSAALQLATTYNQLAVLGDYMRDADYALPNYQRTIELLKELVARAPNEPTLWDRYAQAQANMSAPLRFKKRYEEAEATLAGAVAAARRTAQLAPDSEEAKYDLRIDCSWLARARCDLGLWEQAAQSAAEMTTAHPEPWKSWSGAAVELAHIVAGVREDSALSAEQRAALESQFAAQAVTYLRAAVERNIPGSRDLHTIKDLSGLYGVEEFETYAKERLESGP